MEHFKQKIHLEIVKLQEGGKEEVRNYLRIFTGRREVDSFNAQESSKHQTFLAFSFSQTSVSAYNFIFCMIFFHVSVSTSPLVLKQIRSLAVQIYHLLD